jgi:hypothetical protein
MPMFERILRVWRSEAECVYPDREACFQVTPYGFSACVRSHWQKIPDDDWTCDLCGAEFDRLEKHYEPVTGPEAQEIFGAPKVLPNMRAVPAVARIWRLCRECSERVSANRANAMKDAPMREPLSNDRCRE